ncbi:hypothetical protein V1509DRAFT_642901 [Lipomyces kononenkoae]
MALSTMPATLSKHNSPVSEEPFLSNSNEALRLLKENPAEQRLDVPLTYPKYLELEDEFSRYKLDENISDDRRYQQLR